MFRKLILFLVVVACMLVMLGVSPAMACNGAAAYTAQVVGFAEPCAPAYTAPQSFWYGVPTATFYQPPPAAFVQQEVLGYAPQPVAQINTAYVKTYRAPQQLNLVGFANTGYAATGSLHATRGRFAGNPAVGAVHGAQLNLGLAGGVQTGRARVLRPTLFKRQVAGGAAVGAVVVPGGY